jgi:thiol-disulfide isomerase/thioredoxin
MVGGSLLTVCAADPGAVRSADGPPILGERVGLRSLAGDAIPFAESLGPNGRAVCFAFLHPACPLAQEYAPVLNALADEFADKGIRFVGVVCEVDDAAEVEAYRGDFGITFPLRLDPDFMLAEALDATTTPEVVLVDRDQRIRYAGRIDDRYKLRGVMTPGDAEPELRNAIEDLLAGLAIREPRTKPAGCPLDRPERPKPATVVGGDGVTFHRDVLPFLHVQCQRCHSPNQAGPFNLLTYDDAVEWVELGLEEIAARRMPPAQIESDLDFRVVKPPTAAEVAMLRAWVAAGKPEGDPAQVRKLEPLPDYSAFQENLGPPDIVLEQTEPTQLGAHGNDVYRNLIFPLNRAEDLKLRAIQFLPGNRKIVHHALIGHLPRETVEEAVRDHGGREGFSHPDDRAGGFQDPHGIGFRVPPVRDDGQPRALFVGGFVPGVRAVAAPADAAVVIPAGCDIVVQAHYVRTGKLETDSSRVGIWLEKQPPRKVTTMIYLSGDFAVVPAGVTDFRVTGTYTLPEDADMVGVIPHAHQLARWVEIRAHVPGQEKSLLLLRVPQWDYNWQSPYNLRKPMLFPAGTRFEAECSYDNSSANPRNPFDPPRDVWHNETIHDEMLLPMFTFVSEKPLDPKGDTFKKFYSSVVRSRFLRRLVDHRYKYVADPMGVITVSPDYDPDDHRY